MGRNNLSIPKLQRLYRWSLWMDKLFHLIYYNRCDYISMLPFKSVHVSKTGARGFFGGSYSREVSSSCGRRLWWEVILIRFPFILKAAKQHKWVYKRWFSITSDMINEHNQTAGASLTEAINLSLAVVNVWAHLRHANRTTSPRRL